MAPVRIQRKRTKGWRMPDNTVSVTRPGVWGNPFDARLLGATLAVEMFRELMRGFFDPGKLAHLTDEQFHTVYDAKNRWRRRLHCGVEYRSYARSVLRGKNLACFCALVDQHGNYVPCHADVLISIANDVPMETVINENFRRAKGEAAQ